jgi:hypothetical protein
LFRDKVTTLRSIGNGWTGKVTDMTGLVYLMLVVTEIYLCSQNNQYQVRMKTGVSTIKEAIWAKKKITIPLAPQL